VDDISQPWISIFETQAVLRLSRSAIYELIDKDELVRVKVGRRSFVTTASINDYTRRVAGAPQ
jgi:hypothetical protein